MRTFIVSSIAALGAAQLDDLVNGLIDTITPEGISINVSINGLTSSMAFGENMSTTTTANGDT